MEEEIERERNVGLECRERDRERERNRETNGLNTKHREREGVKHFLLLGLEIGLECNK